MPEVLLTNRTRRLRVLLAVLTIGAVCAMTACSGEDTTAPNPRRLRRWSRRPRPHHRWPLRPLRSQSKARTRWAAVRTHLPRSRGGWSSTGLDPRLYQRGCTSGARSRYRVDQVHRSDQLRRRSSIECGDQQHRRADGFVPGTAPARCDRAREVHRPDQLRRRPAFQCRDQHHRGTNRSLPEPIRP